MIPANEEMGIPAHDQQFTIVSGCDPIEDVEMPLMVYQFLQTRGQCDVLASEYIENPDIKNFIVILTKVDASRFVALFVGPDIPEIYRDQYFIVQPHYLGFKGSSFMDTGYFYAPYVPVLQTPPVLDPASFSPRNGILTRYGKKLLEQGKKYYGKTQV